MDPLNCLEISQWTIIFKIWWLKLVNSDQLIHSLRYLPAYLVIKYMCRLRFEDIEEGLVWFLIYKTILYVLLSCAFDVMMALWWLTILLLLYIPCSPWLGLDVRLLKRPKLLFRPSKLFVFIFMCRRMQMLYPKCYSFKCLWDVKRDWWQ